MVKLVLISFIIYVSFKNPIGMKEEGKGLAPMTIFYSGDVSVFTVAPDEVQSWLSSLLFLA